MTDARLVSALVNSEGLATTWADVPNPDDLSTLLLSLLAFREDGSMVQFGAKWITGADDSPVVFAFDTRGVKQRNHEDAASAISWDEHSGVRVQFPSNWVDALAGSDRVPASAVLNIDGIDRTSRALDLGLEDSQHN